MQPEDQNHSGTKTNGTKGGGLFAGMNVLKRAQPKAKAPEPEPELAPIEVKSERVEEVKEEPEKKKKVPFFKNFKPKQENSNNGVVHSENIPQQPKQENNSRFEDFESENQLSTEAVQSANRSIDEKPKIEADLAGDSEINLIDTLDATIPSTTKTQFEDDFINLDFNKPEFEQHVVSCIDVTLPQEMSEEQPIRHLEQLPRPESPKQELTRTEQVKPKKTAFGFIKKSKETSAVQEAHRRDESSVLEKINQNLNDISDTSKGDLENLEFGAELVAFSEKIKTEFKIVNLKPRINDKFSYFIGVVAEILGEGNAHLKAAAEKEERQKAVRERLGLLEKQLEEALTIEDYDKAEALQNEIDSLHAETEGGKEGGKREEKRPASELFEAEREKIADEIKKLSGHKIFIKDKMMFFEESESSNYEKQKKSLEAHRAELKQEINGKSKTFETANSQLSEKKAELSAQIQTSEATLANQNAAKQALLAEIESLKKQLVQKENELFTINKDISVTEESIGGIKRKFDPVLGKLGQALEEEEEQLKSLQSSLAKTEKSIANNEDTMRKVKDELTATEGILADIEELKSAKATALASVTQSIAGYFETLKRFSDQTAEYEQQKAEIESRLEGLYKLREEIRQIETEIEREKSEIAKLQTRIPTVETAKKEAVKSKNFAQAKHFSSELKELETQEQERKAKLVTLLSDLDARQKQMPEVEKKHKELSSELSNIRFSYLSKGLEIADERVKITEFLISVELLDNASLKARHEEFTRTLASMKQEIESLRPEEPVIAQPVKDVEATTAEQQVMEKETESD